jgi:hypothetical protein
MIVYDLGIAWNWQYDSYFINGLESTCRKHGLSVFKVHYQNILEVIALLRAGKIHFRFFLDRASDEEEAFIPLARLIEKSSTIVFNSYRYLEDAKDKATMHLALLSAGIAVPYTIIISPFNKKREIELSLTELAHLGRPFIIKPANTTGGGVGVVLGAESLKEILISRQHHKNDKYLLQETIDTTHLLHRKAWFRSFFAFGKVLHCWWDNETHIYKEVTLLEESEAHLSPLHEILHKIQSCCKLDFFSSEIAVTTKNQFVAIDYVNEMCDMRPQSDHIDGVPNAVIEKIQLFLVHAIISKKSDMA